MSDYSGEDYTSGTSGRGINSNSSNSSIYSGISSYDTNRSQYSNQTTSDCGYPNPEISVIPGNHKIDDIIYTSMEELINAYENKKNKKYINKTASCYNLSVTSATLDVSTLSTNSGYMKYNQWLNSKTLALQINEKIKEDMKARCVKESDSNEDLRSLCSDQSDIEITSLSRNITPTGGTMSVTYGLVKIEKNEKDVDMLTYKDVNPNVVQKNKESEARKLAAKDNNNNNNTEEDRHYSITNSGKKNLHTGTVHLKKETLESIEQSKKFSKTIHESTDKKMSVSNHILRKHLGLNNSLTIKKHMYDQDYTILDILRFVGPARVHFAILCTNTAVTIDAVNFFMLKSDRIKMTERSVNSIKNYVNNYIGKVNIMLAEINMGRVMNLKFNDCLDYVDHCLKDKITMLECPFITGYYKGAYGSKTLIQIGA